MSYFSLALLILATILVTLVVVWASLTAQRLNRLHIRTDAARHSLESALDRRAALVGALIPGAEQITAKAEAIPMEYTKFDDRAKQETLVSEVIKAQANPPKAVVDAAARVELAHRFYNEAVNSTRALQGRKAIRLFKLGGTAPFPKYFDFLDTDTGGGTE